MKDYIVWNGTNTHQLGIVVTELPEPIIPAERVTYVKIPGRSGELATLSGVDIFDDVTITCTCYLKDMSKLNDISSALKGDGILRLPNRPDGYYEARVTNQIPFAKVLKGNSARTFTLNFKCKPMFHLDTGDTEVQLTNSQYITNPTGIKALPIITLVGNGDITLMVGTQMMIFTGLANGIVIDSELQEAYYGNTLKNEYMNGDFPSLFAGSTAISWTGGTVLSVKIKPRWVTL